MNCQRPIAVGSLCCLSLLCVAAAPAQDFLEQLERTLAREEAVRASAPAGYLGLAAEATSGRVTVAEVHEGSPAAKADIRPGDIVERINSRPVADLDTMGAVLAPLPAGRQIVLTLKRGEQVIVAPVTLAARPSIAKPVAPEGPRPSEPAPVDGALDALETLERQLDAAPPEKKPAHVAPATDRIGELEAELAAMRAHIQRLEQAILELRSGDAK
ncbi:MAG: PDZ domain-containing protein [Planctomycetales bacterium]|nr:PDZ domain-containing protein [Planctomycetales bacterium]